MLLRKCQKLCVALVAMCLWIPSTSWALGLGEIEVDSALNERFSATIDLLDADGLQVTEIIISMASREDFDRVGVERFFYLTTIAFKVEMNQGVPQVIVTSSQPIAEPYLDFIVEVKWPSGRLLKEYTVLLDPPTFSETVAAPVRPPAQPIARAEPQTSAPRPTVTRQPTRVAVPTERAGSRPTPVDGDGLMTTRSDTLWTIAERTLPSNQVTMNQQMLAIQRLNRDAFIRDNINLLKAGYRLQIPDEGEALSMSSADANLAVANQTNAWRTGDTSPTAVAQTQQATPLVDDEGETLRSPIDATPSQPTTAAPVSEGEGRVRIVANTGEAAGGSAGGTDVEVNQLIEEKSSLERQVDELTYQLDREKEIAANQVSVKERQLDVKDQEIAQLQEQMKQMREELSGLSQNQNQSTNSQPAEQAWWMSPLFLGGVIGLLVLFLAFMLIALRRSRQDNDALADALEDSSAYDADDTPVGAVALAADDADDAFDESPHVQLEPTIGAADVDAAEPSIDDLADVAQAEDEGAAAEEAETGDVIGEAEIYIAYGRYGQAANLLINVLNNEPERYDVRLKLLEVFAESGDEEQFAQHAQYIVDNCEDEEVLLACRELEGQLNAGTVALDDIDSDEAQGSDTGNGSQEEADDDSDFSLELDDVPAAAGLGGVAAADDLSADVDELEASVDDSAVDQIDAAADEFELEFDDDALEETIDDDVKSSSSAVDDLGGDLGLDFDPDRDLAEVADTAAAPEIDELTGASEPDEAFSLDDFAGEEVAPLESVADDLDLPETVETVSGEEDDGFEFDGGGDADINATKIDLAEAYIDMGDADGARDILAEVAEEGTTEQKEQARKMLESIDG